METGDAPQVRMSDIAKAAKVSRQAVYLHFETRAELLVATTAFMDEALDVEARLAPFRAAQSGIDKIEALVRFWGDYVHEIQGVARALLAMRATDEAARTAWDARMATFRADCMSSIRSLSHDRLLADLWEVEVAGALFCSMLSFDTWESLTKEAEWTTEDYVDRLTAQAILSFVTHA